MLDIRPMPAQLDAERLSAMRRAGVSTFGHQRLWGICAPAITPLFACAPVAGTAVTLALPGPDSVLLHDTIELLRAGDILVIDRLGDERHACVGGIVARAAKLRGVAALVVDGPVTDAVELADIGLPIWCRGLSGQTTRRLALGGRRNCPVAVGGAVVEAGDAMLCDRDGVMAISPDQLDEALAQYNLDRRDTLITDPDFIFGVGLKYRLFSGQGRNSDVSAARATQAQAEAGVREAQVQIETGVKVAHAQVRSAQERHALYGRTIAAADEALRVARLSFRELQGTSRDVTDAELGAGRVRVEQARAAHDAILALISLLQVSGQLHRLPEFLPATREMP